MLAVRKTSYITNVKKIIRDRRQDFLERYVDLDAWKKLSRHIKNFAPNYVVLQARRMPRLWRLLREQNIFNFKATFVSDFAIENIAWDFCGKSVAIIDDAVNTGATLRHVLDQVSGYEPKYAHCYALVKKENGGQELDSDKITYVGCKVEKDSEPKKELQDPAYRKVSTRTALALWLLNMPFECEFPIYRFEAHRSMPNWPIFLTEIFGTQAVHRLDIDDAAFLGLARYAVDLRPNSNLNDKLRIYVDSESNEVIIAPMAAVSGDTYSRYAQSLRLMEEFSSCFESKGKLVYERKEAKLLFGPKGEIPRAAVEYQRASSSEFMSKEWPEIKKNLTKNWSLYECFYDFFMALKKHQEMKQASFPGHPCIGPTFVDLLQIMEEIWEDCPKREILHSLLSQLLDEQIDRGFVVPQCDSSYNRIFRKGEPLGYDIILASTMKSLGKPISPDEDIMDKKASLEPNEREYVDAMFRKYQTLRISENH